MSKVGEDVIRNLQVEDVEQLPDVSELPERLTEAAVLYEALGHNWFETLSKTALADRKNGYQLPTLILFFFALFTSGFRPSIKTVCDELSRRGNRLLAAFARQERFPQQSSVSRFLKCVSLSRLEQSMAAMLVFSLKGAREFLNHPACACRDTFGGAWQLFDLDPTATVLRQRSLPDEEELPPARRHSDTIAEPGYTGRKRGEVLFRRIVLQHTGSSLWLGTWLRPGNKGARKCFAAAVETVLASCEFAGFDRQKAILRIDGEGANVPTMTACIEAGICHLTRCVHYSILENPQVRRRLAQGGWFEVKDSGSGPRRYALDLGEMELFAAQATTRGDGTAYKPVHTRVVVSRFEAEAKTSSGVFIDNALYELYATGLPQDCWPAEEVVQLYYHHVAQENCFGREDKELGLDTVFSTAPGGQSLATLIGQLVWNLRRLLGFQAARQQLAREPLAEPTQRQPRSVCLPAPVWPSPSPKAEQPDNGEIAAEAAAPEEKASEKVYLLQKRLHEEIEKQAGDLTNEKYHWSLEEGLRCMEGHPFEPRRLRIFDGKPYLIFLAPPQSCGGCPSRFFCSQSVEPNLRRERMVALADATEIEALLKELRQAKEQAKRLASRSKKRHRSRPHPTPPASIEALSPIALEESGPLNMVLPHLNTAALKHRFEQALQALAIRVQVHPKPPPEPIRRYTYATAAQRARRRRSWAERLSYNEYPGGIDITILREPAAATLLSVA